MNQVLLYALLAALVFVRALPLHGHWHDHGEHSPPAHHTAGHAHHSEDVHTHFAHGHVVNAHADSEHGAGTIEIDLLGSALMRDIASVAPLALITSLFTLLLAVLWVCIGRQLPPLFLSPAAPLLPGRPSPRAPPR